MDCVDQCPNDRDKTTLDEPFTCESNQGDGVGGYEKYLSIETDTHQACADYVAEHEPGANGATWSPTGHSCFAEYGMTSDNDSESWVTCYVPIPKCGCNQAD